jgi:DNA-binding HxlR family transcriptional regulator
MDAFCYKVNAIGTKKTFKEFSESDESIALSILSKRLKTLEKIEFIVKQKLSNNQSLFSN